jgi:hypothetical protein
MTCRARRSRVVCLWAGADYSFVTATDVPMSPVPYVEYRSLNHGSAEFE